MKNNPTAITVVAAALIDREGQVLMQQRPANKAHGGLWEFPGGKVEPCESAVFALCREIAEELDLTIEPGDLAYLAAASDPDSGIVLSLYTCRRWIGEARCLDAAQLGWFAPHELDRLAMPPLDVPLAAALCSALNEAN